MATAKTATKTKKRLRGTEKNEPRAAHRDYGKRNPKKSRHRAKGKRND